MEFIYMNDVVRSAARVLDVLEYLAREGEGASLKDACGALGYPKSSMLMLLRTLVIRGYAVRDASDRYNLDPVFRSHGFGWGVQRHARLIAVARPIMEQLCAEVGETVLLGCAEQNRVRLLEKVVTKQLVGYDVELSSLLPLYCTAIGRILLAQMDISQQIAILGKERREALTPKTLTDPEAILAAVATAQKDGFAAIEEELVIGGTGVAAPIQGCDGDALAVLNIACVSARFTDKKDRILENLLHACRRISDSLGGHTK